MSRKYRSSIARSSTATSNVQVPMPCKVQEDAEQRPVSVRLLGKLLAVESIEERWEDAGDWWKDNPLVRVTYQVTLEDGQRLTIFKNMLTGGWYRASNERPMESDLAA